jgi:hypothetical protein
LKSHILQSHKFKGVIVGVREKLTDLVVTTVTTDIVVTTTIVDRVTNTASDARLLPCPLASEPFPLQSPSEGCTKGRGEGW